MIKNHNDFNKLWSIAQILVYFCGKNGELLPTEELFFLMEFVCALNEFLTNKEEFHPFGDLDYKKKEDFINKKLSSIFSNLEVRKNVFTDQLSHDLEEMTKLTWNNDEWGDSEYTCVFLMAYKALRDNSGYCGSTFRLRSKEIEKLEKVIPTMSSEFFEFCQKIVLIIRKYVDNDIDPKTSQLKGYCW